MFITLISLFNHSISIPIPYYIFKKIFAIRKKITNCDSQYSQLSQFSQLVIFVICEIAMIAISQTKQFKFWKGFAISQTTQSIFETILQLCSAVVLTTAVIQKYFKKHMNLVKWFSVQNYQGAFSADRISKYLWAITWSKTTTHAFWTFQ